MTFPLVECIPNFSEARRPEVVKAILQAITNIQGISLLDQHSDNDHNRTVVTFAGSPQAVEEAAFFGIQKAAELIDLNQHSGSHPRIGATDVVPFVPISGVSMADCVKLTRRLGARVAKELNIPVYLYEEASTSPERHNLENIRRGQFEILKNEILSDSQRKPDFGASRLGPAGATVIGARQPLVAFNIYLETDDVQTAKAIAKTVRQSSGGLPCVKALGMMVDGRAQVSMNLTNTHQTSVARAFEAVRIEAIKHGTRVHHSEVVGLIPQTAMNETATELIQLKDFSPDQILENRLQTGQASQTKVSSFLDELASEQPVPGGGSAAAYAGAMAAALVGMVARLTIGKKKYESVDAQMKEILVQTERLRSELTEAVQEDADAFEAVMDAFRLPKNTPEHEIRRNQAIEEATKQAAEIPLQVAQRAVNVMALAERAAALGNLNAITDAGSAAALARASLSAAGYNVRINLAGLHDQITIDIFNEKIHVAEERANTVEKEIKKVLTKRGNLSLGQHE